MMSTTNKSRTGHHRLARSPARGLNRRLDRYTTRMLGGIHRPPRPNDLALACRCLKQVVHLHERWAREDPELWGPGWIQRDLDRLEREQMHREIEAALERVYGPTRSPSV